MLRNGVDLELFRPEDRAQARAAFGMHDEFALASVGHLIERKGYHLVIEALPQRAATRAYAEQFGWQPTTDGQLALFRSVLRKTA